MKDRVGSSLCEKLDNLLRLLPAHRDSTARDISSRDSLVAEGVPRDCFAAEGVPRDFLATEGVPWHRELSGEELMKDGTRWMSCTWREELFKIFYSKWIISWILCLLFSSWGKLYTQKHVLKRPAAGASAKFHFWAEKFVPQLFLGPDEGKTTAIMSNPKSAKSCYAFWW